MSDSIDPLQSRRNPSRSKRPPKTQVSHPATRRLPIDRSADLAINAADPACWVSMALPAAKPQGMISTLIQHSGRTDLSETTCVDLDCSPLLHGLLQIVASHAKRCRLTASSISSSHQRRSRWRRTSRSCRAQRGFSTNRSLCRLPCRARLMRTPPKRACDITAARRRSPASPLAASIQDLDGPAQRAV